MARRTLTLDVYVHRTPERAVARLLQDDDVAAAAPTEAEALEKLSAPLANVIGWHSDFALETVLQEERLQVERQESIPPFGMMTFLVLGKQQTM